MSEQDFQRLVLTELGGIKAILASQQAVIDERFGHYSKELEQIWQRIGTLKGRATALEEDMFRRKGGMRVLAAISAAVGSVVTVAVNVLLRIFMQIGV